MKRMKVAELVLDFDLYPRHELDSHNCGRLREILEAGGEFDAVVIDKKSKRVVDGFHRTTVKRRYGGDDAKMAVIERDYPDEEALLLDMIRLNARHGKPLSSFDHARIVLLAKKLNIDPGKIAEVLQIRRAKIDEITTTRMAHSAEGNEPIVLKRTTGHLAGSPLTARQEQANNRASGMTPMFYVNQVLNLVENDLIDEKDEHVIQALRRLHGALEKYVTAQV